MVDRQLLRLKELEQRSLMLEHRQKEMLESLAWHLDPRPKAEPGSLLIQHSNPPMSPVETDLRTGRRSLPS